MASIDTSPGRGKFGADPAAYDLARPGYCAALFEWLRETCALGHASDCFEIGAANLLVHQPSAVRAERRHAPGGGRGLLVVRDLAVRLPRAWQPTQ